MHFTVNAIIPCLVSTLKKNIKTKNVMSFKWKIKIFFFVVERILNKKNIFKNYKFIFHLKFYFFYWYKFNFTL